MSNIVTDETKQKIFEKDRMKLREQLSYRQQELGLRGMQPLKHQNELQQLEDIKHNASKIEDTMEEAKQRRQQSQRQKRREQRIARMKAAPQIYFRRKKEMQKKAFEARKIVL